MSPPTATPEPPWPPYLASRVAGQAKGGEILVSSPLRQLVDGSIDPSVFGAPREMELKGLSGTHTVYTVPAP